MAYLTRNREKSYDNVGEVLEFAQDKFLLNVNTAMPGNIENYDKQSRRATVKPALKTLMADGTQIEKALIVDVPVVFPSSPRFSLSYGLKQGDPVMLIFSQRDIAKFKESLETSDISAHGFFSLSDAIAIAGFGALTNTTPYANDGIGMHNTDSSVYVAIEDTTITINTAGNVQVNADQVQAQANTIGLTASNSINLTAPMIELNGQISAGGSSGGATTFSGDAKFNGAIEDSNGIDHTTHRHGGVTTGGDNTGDPEQ